MAKITDIAILGIIAGIGYMIWSKSDQIFGALGAGSQAVGDTINVISGGVQDAQEALYNAGVQTGQAVANAQAQLNQAGVNVVENLPNLTGVNTKYQSVLPPGTLPGAQIDIMNWLIKTLTGVDILPRTTKTETPQVGTPEQEAIKQAFYSGKASISQTMTAIENTLNTTPSPIKTGLNEIRAVPGINYVTDKKVNFRADTISKGEVAKLIEDAGYDPGKFKWLSSSEAYYWFT